MSESVHFGIFTPLGSTQSIKTIDDNTLMIEHARVTRSNFIVYGQKLAPCPHISGHGC